MRAWSNILEFMAPFNMCLYSNFNLIKPENTNYIMPVILVDTKTKTIKQSFMKYTRNTGHSEYCKKE